MKNQLYDIVCESISLLEYSQLNDEEIKNAEKKLSATKKYALAGAGIMGIPTALFHKNKGLKAQEKQHIKAGKETSDVVQKAGHEKLATDARHGSDTAAIKKSLYYGALGGTVGAVAGKIHDKGVRDQLKGKASKQSLVRSALKGAGAGAVMGAAGGFISKSGIRSNAWTGAGLGTLAGMGAGMLYNKGVQKARDYIVNRNKKEERQALANQYRY